MKLRTTNKWTALLLGTVLALCVGAWAQDEAADDAQKVEDVVETVDASPEGEQADAGDGSDIAEPEKKDTALDKAMEMETARKSFDQVKDVDGLVLGVTAVDTFMETSKLFRGLMLLGGASRFLKSADLYHLYVQAYIASMDDLTLADVDEERLTTLQTEIEAGQLGAREGEMKKEWMGMDALVAPKYGYAKIKGWGPMPRAFSRLTVATPGSGEKYTVVNTAPYSYGGSSDPLMAYNAVKQLKITVPRTPEQRELIGKINERHEKAMGAESAGWIMGVLVGFEAIGAGIFAQVAENRSEGAGEKTVGFAVAKWALWGLGGFSIVAAPLNPIAAAIQRGKAKKLEKQYAEKFGEPYPGGESVYKSYDRSKQEVGDEPEQEEAQEADPEQ